ncbi:hypothetical protein BKA57DRAFT_535266 [Linnemannia elongata]|nr:hypothetical protein BKA57DRAFT_535266 [Linnemannia elongata]
MNNNHLTLFCLVDGEATSNLFPAKVSSSDTLDDRKALIEAKNINDFSDIDTHKLTLCSCTCP